MIQLELILCHTFIEIILFDGVSNIRMKFLALIIKLRFVIIYYVDFITSLKYQIAGNVDITTDN